MKFVFFYHSLLSDWNHGNAHFLRGVVAELLKRDHEVVVFEPEQGWSLGNLLRAEGQGALRGFRAAYPQLGSRFYRAASLDLSRALSDADVVLVHEWNDPELVAAIGEHHRRHGGYRLLFHDTHHRSVTDPAAMAGYDLGGYDGVLAFGEAVARQYARHGWAQQVWVWHEAADIERFHPHPAIRPTLDLVWVGNWGDEERDHELEEFLLAPVQRLGLRAAVYGVRYPDHALRRLREAGIDYRGWLPNYRVPLALAEARLTVHIPRRAYVERLPGIPTIRVFEALACGMPLVSAPWEDREGLFRVGEDFRLVADGAAMAEELAWLLDDPAAARRLAERGREAVLSRHNCAHRVEELLALLAELAAPRREAQYA